MTAFTSMIRLLLLFTLAILLIVLFYLGFYVPGEKNILHLKSEINRLQIQMDDLKKEKLALQTQIQKQPIKPSAPSQEILAGLPEALDMATLLSQWTLHSKKLGIESIRFKPLLEKNLGPIIEIPIDVTLQGTFHQILDFLNALKSFLPKITLSHLEMAHPVEINGKTVISTQLRMTTYRKSGESPS